MMNGREEYADSLFVCTDSERAAFEAGIKMGTVYHQFVGTPVDHASVESLERAIEASLMVQPYVDSVRVSINRDMLPPREDTYSYASLTGEMLDVTLVILTDSTRLSARLRHVSELDYPLMYIDEIQQI